MKRIHALLILALLLVPVLAAAQERPANYAKAPRFKALRRQHHDHLLEQVGKRLRKMMSWIDEKEF